MILVCSGNLDFCCALSEAKVRQINRLSAARMAAGGRRPLQCIIGDSASSCIDDLLRVDTLDIDQRDLDCCHSA